MILYDQKPTNFLKFDINMTKNKKIIFAEGGVT